MDENQIHELRCGLQLIKLLDSEEFPNMVQSVVTEVENLNLQGVPNANRNFVRAKHLVHYFLLCNFVKPRENPAATSIAESLFSSTGCTMFYYASNVEIDVSVIASNSSRGYSFVAYSETSGATSGLILLSDEDLASFFDPVRRDPLKQKELSLSVCTTIQAFLRKKQLIPDPPSPTAEHLQKIAVLKEFLYV